MKPADNTEIFTTIKALKNTKSVGEDEIPVILLKYIAEEITPPLTYIINLCMSTGIFPDRLKLSHIKAIYKKGDKKLINNYRPIAILNTLSKVFEKIIYTRLMLYLEKNKILFENQHGFRQNKTTILAIYKALTNILDSLNNQQYTFAMYLDLSKAFDSVDHDILIQKMEIYGIRGVPLKLMKSYLYQRLQCTVETDKSGTILKSDTRPVTVGVPQGSILGPLLYLLYTNELPSIVSQAMLQYADDTSIIFSEPDAIDINNKIFSTLSDLETFFTSNNLQLNITKTQVIKFSYQNNDEILLTNGISTLETVKNVSFLGVKIDSRLDWKCHINTLAQNLSKYMYALKIISQTINIQAAFIAYHGYIQSRVRYGIMFWGNSTDFHKIFVLQKRCLRNIMGMKQIESCRPVFLERNILTLISIYIYESVIFIKENKDLFTDCDRNHIYNTRNKTDLTQPKAKFTYIAKNVKCSIIKVFNKLPIELRNLPTNKLKHKLKNLLLQKVYYSLDEYYKDTDL